MSKYACVDIGGTFTDASVLDENGQITVFKSPTTPNDYSQGMIGALKNAAEYYKIPLKELLESCSIVNGGRLTHGSTIATNAVVEKKAGKIGIICTKGFRDVLLFRNAPERNPYNIKIDFPEPYVPRYLTLPVTERMNAEGEVVFPLNEDEVANVALKLKEYNVEAIAVCFLWSTANDEHEKMAKRIINKVCPDITVVLSSEVNPQVNEYRRFVAAAMDASLRKLVSTYAGKLNNSMNKVGFIGEVGMLNAYGGVMSPKEISEKPLFSIDSGPAMAPVSGRAYANLDMNEKNAVILDMGGTTFDISCVVNDKISVSRDSVIGNEVPGIARVAVHSIGAGGGSIAWVDSGNMLRVGPRSAGSVPGPACYQRGGTLPTVTDANALLGFLNPDYFNDGKMTLDIDASYKAIKEHIADKLGIDVYEAAFSIWTTVNANMVTAIKDVTIWHGVDPREHIMIAGGGACGLHALPLAKGLEMKKMLIPKTAGGLSATGGLFSELVTEYQISAYMETRNFNCDLITEKIQQLFEKASNFLERNDIPKENRKVELYMDGRYPAQVWDLSILVNENIDENFKFDNALVKQIEESFHAEHERNFSIKDAESHVNCFTWRVRAIGIPKKKANIAKFEISEKTKPSPKTYRDVYSIDDKKMIKTPVYDGNTLYAGNYIEGPAIIEEATTTIAVLKGYTAQVTEYNNYFFDLTK